MNETEYYEVDIHRYAEKAGLAYNVAYQEVKALAKKHSETSLNVTLPSGAIWCTPLIYDFVYDDSEKYVKIKWNKKLIPLISDLDSMEDGIYIIQKQMQSPVIKSTYLQSSYKRTSIN